MIGDETPEEYLLRVLEALASNGLSPDIYQKYLFLKTIHPPRQKATNFVIALLQQLLQALTDAAQARAALPPPLNQLILQAFQPARAQQITLLCQDIFKVHNELRTKLQSAQQKAAQSEAEWRVLMDQKDQEMREAQEERELQQEQMLASVRRLEQRLEQVIQECANTLSGKEGQINSLHALYEQKLRLLSRQVEEASRASSNQGLLQAARHEIELLQKDLSSQTQVISQLYESYVRPVARGVEQFRQYSKAVQGSNVEFLLNLVRKLQVHNAVLGEKAGLCA